MPRTAQEIDVALRNACLELYTAENKALRAKCMDAINTLLDEQLALSGAHPAECDCDECIETVRQALAHRLGEAIGDEDTATITDWGHAG